MASMAINPLREDNLRLQGVTWIDNVRRELNLYVKCPLFPRRFANGIGPFGLLTLP